MGSLLSGLSRMFTAMAAEKAKKRRKLVQTPVYRSNLGSVLHSRSLWEQNLKCAQICVEFSSGGLKTKGEASPSHFFCFSPHSITFSDSLRVVVSARRGLSTGPSFGVARNEKLIMDSDGDEPAQPNPCNRCTRQS